MSTGFIDSVTRNVVFLARAHTSRHRGVATTALENWETICEAHKFRCDNLKNGSFIHLFQ